MNTLANPKPVRIPSQIVFDARNDLKVFSEYCWPSHTRNKWFHEKWYDTIQDYSVKSGLIIAPRNSAKSTCWGRVSPLWLLGANPDLRVVIVSRTSELAKIDLRFIKQSVESNDRVKEVFPAEEIAGRFYGLEPSTPWGANQLTVRNNRNDGVPSVYAVGLGGSISGIRADIIVVDDLIDMNNVMTESQRSKIDDFWDNVVLPTLNPGGRIFCVGTRYHAKDFYSRLLEDPMYRDNTFMFPALELDEFGEYVLGEDGEPISYWPERWPTDELLKMKERMGTLAFNSQYQCDPSGYAGRLFDPDDIQFYNPKTQLQAIWDDLDFLMAVDPNVTEDPESDNTAIITAAVDRKRGRVYVMDIYAKPLDFVNQVKELKRHATRTQVVIGDHRVSIESRISKIGVEAVAYQRSLQQTGYLMGLPVVEVKQGNRNKEIRILGLQPHFENGRIRIPDPEIMKTNWYDAFYEEYCTFPKGRRDDMLDCLEILVSMVSGSFGVTGIPWGPGERLERRPDLRRLSPFVY